MRALLVVNPKATTTSDRSRDVLVHALRADVRLEVAYTLRRGHAADLARAAAESGVDLVIVHGGDGTVNEAVNGIMAASIQGTDGRDRPGERPAFAVVPGGSTNVFARALGLPKEWTEATGAILEALRDGRRRIIGLGRADDRYFTFCAGLGLDAAVVRRVERARLRGRTATPALYLRSAVGQYLFDAEGRRPAITLERPGEPAEAELATVIVQNCAPWTYLGDRPVNPNPQASFDTGLDLMALRNLKAPTTARTVTQILSSKPNPHGRQTVTLHDLEEFTLIASRPQAFQLDGDYLGEREKVRFSACPRALWVVC